MLNIRYLSISLTIIFLISLNTQAKSRIPLVNNKSGMYLGFQLANADIHVQSQYSIYPVYVPNQYAGRLFAGLNINQYAGVEMGFTYYQPHCIKSSVSTASLYDPATGLSNEFRDEVNIKFGQQSLDLVGRVTLPLKYGFAIYGKAGAALILHQVNFVESGDSVNSKTNHTSYDFNPTITAGLQYDFTSNLSGDIFLTQIYSTHGLSIATQFYGAGITVKLG